MTWKNQQSQHARAGPVASAPLFSSSLQIVMTHVCYAHDKGLADLINESLLQQVSTRPIFCTTKPRLTLVSYFRIFQFQTAILFDKQSQLISSSKLITQSQLYHGDHQKRSRPWNCSSGGSRACERCHWLWCCWRALRSGKL